MRIARRRLARTAALLSIVASTCAWAQSPGAIQITGSITAAFSAEEGVQVSFTCTGTSTCTGTFRASVRDSGCSNFYALVNGIALAGVEPTRVAGPIQGTVTLSNFVSEDRKNPDGTCSFGQFQDLILPYAGSWDGTRGSFSATVTDHHGRSTVFNGAFTADRSPLPPVFPMSVAGGIDVDAGNAAATIQYRAQDLGTAGSVYVFALAPASLVKDAGGLKDARVGWMASDGPRAREAPASAKDAPIACVLAQLTSSGQLQAVSASNLQAYVSGVLTAQGQAVTILNGVPAANIGGATFYVGYGPSSAAMINSGTNRSTITAPGAAQCAPAAPQTGWWWNPLEDGRGFSLEVRGNHFFFAAFLYDVTGRSTWYVATGDHVSLDGSLITGDLLSARGGQSLGGAYPGFPSLDNVGPITLAFNDASHGTLVWPGGVVPVQRFNIVTDGLTAAPRANQPEAGWWWNPDESGRGFFMEWQGGVLDIAGYMYDDAGNPVWYLTENPTPSTNLQSFESSWWSFANGQTLTGAWKPNVQTSSNVAPVTIQFQGADHAVMTLPNGRSTALTRHRF